MAIGFELVLRLDGKAAYPNALYSLKFFEYSVHMMARWAGERREERGERLQDLIETAPAEPTRASDGTNKCVMTRCDVPGRAVGRQGDEA